MGGALKEETALGCHWEPPEVNGGPPQLYEDFIRGEASDGENISSFALPTRHLEWRTPSSKGLVSSNPSLWSVTRH